ncbi:MAG: glycosyltransferase WbuB [Phycisphaerales bacterium]|nr:glycosyltransferase WbuB [Phycisphaerales bacterium]
MHILFLTDNFPPEVNAPASRTFEHCREWVKQGQRVTVITGVPNFPTGKVFAGYTNKLWQTEEMDGIRVIRVWTYITANEGFRRRVLDYISFMVSAVIAAFFVGRVDVVVGTSPQFFTVLGAWIVSVYKRRPFVFELRDLWPESIRVVGAMKDSFALRMLERLELFLYRRAHRIVSVTHAFKANLIARGIKGAKIHVVTNGVDVTRFVPQARDESLVKKLGLEGRFVAGYIGTHGLAHALESVLDAAHLAQSQGDESITFVLLGDGARKDILKGKAEKMGLRNVRFVDSVGKDEVPKYWALLDVAIIHLRRTPLFETVIPSKLFECMGMGIPVLHGVAGESAEIVVREGVGIPFTPEDPAELLAALRRLKHDADLYARYHTNCLRAARNYDRTTLALNMLDVLRGLRILLLNQAFWPDVVATAQHADDLARFMVAHGDDVTVVASRAIYGERGAALSKRTTREGIEIYRVGLQFFGKGGIASRSFDFTLFYLAAAWRCVILPRHDVVICFTTPPFIALVGVVLKWVKGTRVVYWTMDLYPDVAGAAGLMKRGSVGWRILQWIDRICLRNSDRVVALGRCMKEVVVRKGAIESSVRTICVWSGAETIAGRPRDHNPLRKQWSIGDRFTILYVGNFGLGHDMEAIAGAVELLKDNDDIRWLFVGEGKTKSILEARIHACGAKNVIVRGYQTREQLADVLDVGDAHLVTLLPGWDGLILPSKFFSVLAACKPVLWIGPAGSECVTILRENKCGFEIAAGDSVALTERIRYLIANEEQAHEMGRRGRAAYDAKYSMQRACEQWREVLHEVAKARR